MTNYSFTNIVFIYYNRCFLFVQEILSNPVTHIILLLLLLLVVPPVSYNITFIRVYKKLVGVVGEPLDQRQVKKYPDNIFRITPLYVY